MFYYCSDVEEVVRQSQISEANTMVHNMELVRQKVLENLKAKCNKQGKRNSQNHEFQQPELKRTLVTLLRRSLLLSLKGKLCGLSICTVNGEETEL